MLYVVGNCLLLIIVMSYFFLLLVVLLVLFYLKCVLIICIVNFMWKLNVGVREYVVIILYGNVLYFRCLFGIVM